MILIHFSNLYLTVEMMKIRLVLEVHIQNGAKRSRDLQIKKNNVHA